MGQPGMPGSQFPGEDAQGRKLKDLERAVQQFAAANVLATAGISTATGGVLVDGFMEFKREDGTRGAKVDPVTGAFTAYNATGLDEVARFGALVNTAPGEYGVEVLVGSTWVQVGAQATTWDTVTGKPTTFTPSAHTHVGADVTSGAVPEAEGSQYGWTNNVGGTEYYAVYVGNNGGYKFGRNVSSIRYKENVWAHNNDPLKVLNLRPVLYDRINGRTNEYGLIAEQVAEHAPELISWFDGQIDSVRYELLAVKHQDVLINHENRLRALEGNPERLPTGTLKATTPAPGAPATEPAPLPYVIQE